MSEDRESCDYDGRGTYLYCEDGTYCCGNKQCCNPLALSSIIGMGIAGIIFLLFAAVIIYFCVRKNNRNPGSIQPQHEENMEVNGISSTPGYCIPQDGYCQYPHPPAYSQAVDQYPPAYSQAVDQYPPEYNQPPAYRETNSQPQTYGLETPCIPTNASV
ncbi:uncharacterized protein LOC128229811 [Mya arenaria]|uniref:uncharacterized protein LOC128229811 n=1 Tax=Mya arenaria TaxID=6604 RepID=UPI0022E55F84|nr:uncharacterized protein LOC128229811 [Mya arenaria]